MKHAYLIVLLTVATIISCRKDAEKPALPEVPGAVAVRLHLTGGFSASESPLPAGRNAGQPGSLAKTLRDSTIYAIMVYRAGTWIPFSSGLFNQADSIVLRLPKDETVSISAYAYKKGSGEGLFYTMRNDTQYFDYPLNTVLINQMDTLHRDYTTNMMWDTVSWLQIANPANLLSALPPVHMPEVDAFYGRTSFSTAAAPTELRLELKRIAFGVQLAADNFTKGTLLLEFPTPYSTRPALPQIITPANISSKVVVIAADAFKHADTLWGGSTDVRIKWIKTIGDTVALGQKSIRFRRNILTRLKVTLPGTGRNTAPDDIHATYSPLSY